LQELNFADFAKLNSLFFLLKKYLFQDNVIGSESDYEDDDENIFTVLDDIH